MARAESITADKKHGHGNRHVQRGNRREGNHRRCLPVRTFGREDFRGGRRGEVTGEVSGLGESIRAPKEDFFFDVSRSCFVRT